MNRIEQRIYERTPIFRTGVHCPTVKNLIKAVLAASLSIKQELIYGFELRVNNV